MWRVATLLAVLLLVACSDDAPPDGSPPPPTTASTIVVGGLTPAQHRRADQLISVFENSTTELQYGYAEDLGDGRGITSGWAGFTTRTCDALDVVQRYGRDPLAAYLPELERLCEEDSDDTSGLDGYEAAWADAAEDPEFRRVQDEAVDDTYFLPAMALADALGLRTAVARAELYDAAIQHGIGEDPDGLPAMIARTGEVADERVWLDAFFRQRIATLEAPADAATAAAWAESVDRVRCLRAVAESGNVDLDGPIHCTVYGDEFTID